MTDWDNLSTITEQHYGYVPELIRMGVNRFYWRDEGRTLGADLDQINNLEYEFRYMRDDEGDMLGHVPPFKVRPGAPCRLRSLTWALTAIAAFSSFTRTPMNPGTSRWL